MLFTIAAVLLILWVLGLVSGYTLGNFLYVLLVARWCCSSSVCSRAGVQSSSPYVALAFRLRHADGEPP